MKSLLKAVLTLTFFTVIDRVLGFIFKIYLSRELGAVNMGIYQVALSFFFMLLTLTTSGLPLSVSKITATTADKKRQGKIVSAGAIIGSCTGVIAILGVIACYPLVRNATGGTKGAKLILFMLPALIFSGIHSGFKGNLWGNNRYFGVSLSEVIEQVVRIGLCVVLFMLGLNKLNSTAISMSVSCGVSCLCVVITTFISGIKMRNPKGEFLPLLRSSLPVTALRTSRGVISSLVAITVPFLLRHAGATTEQAMYIFGSAQGMALPLIYVPLTVIGSLAYALLPSLSAQYDKGNNSTCSRLISNSLSFATCLGAVCVPVFYVLGKNVGITLYDNVDAGKFLSASAWLIVPLSIEGIAGSVLNSLNLEKKGFINFMIGSITQFVVMFAFINSFNAYVFIFATGINVSVTAILNVVAIVKCVGVSRVFYVNCFKSILLILPTITFAHNVLRIFSFLPSLATIIIVSILSVAFMSILCLIFGCVNTEVLGFRSKKIDRQKRIAKTQKA